MTNSQAWREANRERSREYARRYRRENPELCRQRTKRWTQANPDRGQGYHLKKVYGITLKQKNEMIAAQGGRCGICNVDDPGTKLGWQLDADHSVRPPKLRGILCLGCNVSLGKFHHDPELLHRAAEWLTGIKR